MPRKRKPTTTKVPGSVFQRPGREGVGKPWYIRFRPVPGGSRVCLRAVRDDGTPCDTAQEAVSALARAVAAARSEVRQEIARGCRAVTVSEFWREVEETFRARLSPVQFGKVKNQIERFGNVFKVPMHEIGRGEAESYFARIRKSRNVAKGKEPGTGKPLSVATLHRNRVALSRLWKAAIERKAATMNPFTGLNLGRAQERDAPFFTAAQVRRLYSRAPETIRDIVVFLGETGARWSEAAGMTWSQVADGLGSVTFQNTKSGRTRTVPLTGTVSAVLSERLARRVAPLTGMDKVFPDADYDRDVATLQATLTAAGLPHAGFHALRHSYCAGLAAAGVALNTIAALAGHSSMTVTSRYARHVEESEAARAVRQLERQRGVRSAAAGTREASA